MGRVFQSNSDMLHMFTNSIPVKSAHLMPIVERYHKPLCRPFSIVVKEAPDLDMDDALKMTVNAINDSVGKDGLVPSLLVLGALPRLGLPTNQPYPPTFYRVFALREASEYISRHSAP